MNTIVEPDTDTQTRIAMLDLYINHQTFSGLSSVVVMTLLAFVLWGQYPTEHILIWLACGYAVSIGRIFIHRWINRKLAAEKKFSANKVAALLTVAISGSVWGCAAWFFLDMQQTETFIFLVLIISGIGAAAVSTHASYPPAMWVFLTASQGILAAKLLMLDHGSLAVLVIFYGLGLISVTRSIEKTIRKSIIIDFRNEELLQEAVVARESAERANQAKSRFLSTASHDLRQPLHAIMLLINLLKMKADKREEVEKIADNMESSTDAMMALFNSILDISRLDAGVTQPRIVATDLSVIIDTLLLQFKPLADKKGLLLRLDDKRVDRSSALTVMADKVFLERCLNNLVSNAIKFTSSGEVVINILQLDDEMLQVAIVDTGRGIAESDLEKIFQEFTQVSSEQRAQEQGLGLGLSIVARLAKLMHMKLNVSSSVDEGSCFTLEIKQAAAGVLAAVIPEPVSNEVTFSGLRLLLVDDDDAVRENLSALTTSWGCEVFSACDLAGAVAAAKQAEQIDAILMDYGLRDGVTGLDVIEQLYETTLKDKPPALIITGDTSTLSMETLDASGIAYIHKPAKPVTIRNFLQRNCLVDTAL